MPPGPADPGATLPPAPGDGGATLPPAGDPLATLAPDARTTDPAPSLAPSGYEILGELGRGGMGVVYRACQTRANRVVALKMILSGGHADEASLARFRTEGEAVARLQHPGIVQVFEIGEHDGRPFFSLEFCAGGPLDRKLAGTPLPATEAAALVEKLARAMQAAHEARVVHRDLKPANVLLDERGEPRITDFGLARMMDTAGQTQTGSIMGTPSYMAPEQAEGKKEVGPLADVYALGAILYECLTGRPPFRAATSFDTVLQVVTEEPVPPTRLNGKVPRDLETVALKCLHKDPGKRYPTAGDLAADLARFLEGKPVAARPVGRLERGWRWCRRNPTVAGLATAVVLALMAGTGVSLAFAYQAKNSAVAANENARQASSARDLARRHLYVAQAQLAQGAWRESKLPRLATLLEAMRPATGEEDLRGFEWYYLRRLLRGSGRILGQHAGRVNAVAFSNDGRHVASAGIDGEVRLWDTVTRKLLRTLPGGQTSQRRGTLGVAFSQGGRLVTACSDAVRTWEVATGREIWTYPSDGGHFWALAGDLRGEHLLAGSEDNTVQILDARTGKRTGRHGGAGPVHAVATSPEGQYLAWATSAGALQVKDLEKNHLFPDLSRLGQVSGVAFSPDGQRLALARINPALPGHPSPITVLEFPSGKELCALSGHGGAVLAVAFSPDGRRIVSGGNDHTVRVWDVVERKNLLTLTGHTGAVTSVAFGPKGRQVVSGSADGTARLWDVDETPGPRTWPGHQGGVLGLAFSPDGRLLASSGGRDLTVKVWDTATWQEVVRPPGRGLLGFLAFRGDGRQLAAGGLPFAGDKPEVGRSQIWIWDVDGWRETRTIRGEMLWNLAGLAFEPGESRLLAAGNRLTPSEGGRLQQSFAIRRWDVDSGTELPAVGVQGVSGLVLTPEGRYALGMAAPVPGASPVLRVLRVADGEQHLALPTGGRPLFKAACSMDGRWVAAGHGGLGPQADVPGEVVVWDGKTGEQVHVLAGHAKAISGLAFLPGGERLASCSQDGSVKLWDLRTGQEVLTLNGPGGQLAFSPDGRLLAAGGLEGKVSVWDASHEPD